MANNERPKAADEEENADLAVSDDFIRGDAARDSHPTEVAAALRYAAENKYDYGPKLRDADLQWEVNGVEPMGNGISRVFIDYSPSTSFRGSSGYEYFDVDASGSVLARRQIRVPKQALPVVLIALTIVSLISLAVVEILLWANPFASGPELYVAGRTLWIRAELPKSQPYVVYDAPSSEGSIHQWAIEPAGQGTEIVIIETILTNQTSGAVRMVVDREAAELRIKGSIALKPVNVIERSYIVDQSNDRYHDPEFRLMWGGFTLNQGEELRGHVVFEAPIGSQFSDFRWLAGDTAVVRYE
jgi:hypothetical protein